MRVAHVMPRALFVYVYAMTGYCQRRLSKAMENNTVANDMSVRNGNGQIVERLYGRDGFDATFMQRTRLAILNQSNADVQRIYLPRSDEARQLWEREVALRPSPYAVETPELLHAICQAEIDTLNAYKVQLLKQKLHFSGDSLAIDVQVGKGTLRYRVVPPPPFIPTSFRFALESSHGATL
jgi:hypothetical protein